MRWEQSENNCPKNVYLKINLRVNIEM